MNSTSCGFSGNPDIYGPGIRIGYYTQILSVWIANYFVLSESKSLRAVNILFMLALFVGLAWQSRRPSRIHAIEAFLLIQLLCATWYIGVLEKSRYSKKYWRFSPARLVLRNITLIALLGYGIWFWWIGLDLMKPTPCGTWIFFMAKMNLLGWYRSAFKVLSVVAACFHAILTLGHIAQLAQHWRDKTIMTPDFYRRLREDLLREESPESNNAGSCPDAGNGPSRDLDRKPPNLFSTANHESNEKDLQISAISPHHSTEQRSEVADNSNSTIQTSANAAHLAGQQLTKNEDQAPSTPEQNQTNPTQKQIPSTPQPPTTCPPLPSLTDLLTADTYLTAVLTPANPTRIRSYRLPHTPFSISFPLLLLPRPLRPLHLQILIPLLLHIYALRTHPLHTYPTLVFTALLSPHHQTLTPVALCTAIALRTARLPATTPAHHHLQSAVCTLVIVVGLVLATELSIVWNGIRDMGDVGTLGQLVPAVIGIGGLAKVGWTWRRDVGLVHVAEEDGVGAEVRGCADVYERLKGSREVGQLEVV